ncbi:MAG: M16 family metallopeptidase, partial [Bdellovibrionales bacterium]
PYGIPVIGYEDNINTVSRKTILNYFNSRYNPKTMTLLIAGDFKSPEMRKKVDKYFGSFKPNKLRVVKRAAHAVAKKPALIVKTAPFQETIVHIAFPSPKASHKDIAALEVFALIFGQGESSRLNQRLRMNSHLVNYAGSSVFVARDPGFMALSLSLNEKDFSQAMNDLLEEIKSILNSPPSAQELKKALTNMASEQYYFLETVDGLARKYGHYQDLFGDPSYFERFMRQVQNLTAEDIMKVARKYLDPKKASLVIMTPAAQSAIEPVAKNWMKEFQAAGKMKPGKRAAAAKAKREKKISWVLKRPATVHEGIQKWTLDNGITLITRPSFDTPVISLRCASLGGSRLETDSNQGATELLSRVWTAGAGPNDEMKMNLKMDEMAASLSAFGGRNSEGLSMSCLKPFANDMIEMFFETLTEPHFEKQAVTREIKSMLEHVKLRKDNPAQLCILAFMKEMFGDHPYGHDPYGDEEAISNLTQAMVKDIYAQKSGLTLVASGALDPHELKHQVEAALGKLKPGAGKNILYPVKYPKEEKHLFLESKKEQSHIVCGYPGLQIKDPTRYTLQVMQAILAGQGGRLFLELRDKASLAYSVSPMRMEGLEGGYFGAYIGCSPEKAGTALKMMHIEFEKLKNTIVPPEELARAQRYLVGKHDIELQKNSNITSAILFDYIYGIDFLETYHFADRIRAVTSEQIMALAQKIFAGKPVISLVGPSAPW